MITYVAKVTEENDNIGRAYPLTEGTIWTVQNKGSFGFYDGLIFRMIPYIDKGFLRFKKSDESIELKDFNKYIMGVIDNE